MNTAIPAPRPRDPRLRLIVILRALGAALLWFVAQKEHYFTAYSRASFSDYYWPRRGGLILHLAGGSLAISTGRRQWHPGYRRSPH